MRKGSAPPQPPSVAQRERTMFSLCIFNLEDTILDCIDTKLRTLGWIVASLIYDGVSRVAPPSTDTHKHNHCISLLQTTPRDGARPVITVARPASPRSRPSRPGGGAACRRGCSQGRVGLHGRPEREAAVRARQRHSSLMRWWGEKRARDDEPSDPENDPWLDMMPRLGPRSGCEVCAHVRCVSDANDRVPTTRQPVQICVVDFRACGVCGGGSCCVA